MQFWLWTSKFVLHMTVQQCPHWFIVTSSQNVLTFVTGMLSGGGVGCGDLPWAGETVPFDWEAIAFLASSFLTCSRKWIFIWRRRSSDLANRRPQVSQANGFSPVWVRMWVVKWSEREKFLMQIRHWNGFCPVWVRIWRVNSSDLENLLGHVSTGQP